MTPAARHLLPLVEMTVLDAFAVPGRQVCLVIEQPNLLPRRVLIPLSAAEAICKAAQESARIAAGFTAEP